MSHDRSGLAQGYALALLSALTLSTTAIFIRHLTEFYRLPAIVLAFWRAGFAATTLFLALGILRPSLLRVTRWELGYLALYGLVLGGFNATWTVAVALTGASLATVLVNGSAAFTVILAWWLLEEHLGWVMVFAVLLSLAGCVIVSGATGVVAWQANALGILTGIGSALFYAAYSLMGRTASQRGLSPWTVVVYTFAFSCAFLFLLNLVPGMPGSAPGGLFFLGNVANGWAWLYLLAAGPTVVGFGMYNASMKHLPSSIANLIMTSEPVFTMLIAYPLFGERLNGPQLIGSAMTLGGVACLRMAEPWRASLDGSRFQSER